MMTERSSEGLDVRRRRLLFQAWHRGLREVDLLLGRFVDSTIDDLTESELDQLEGLLEVPDPDLLAWCLGDGNVPAPYDTALLHRLRAFHRQERE